jgi:hypothetical protein
MIFGFRIELDNIHILKLNSFSQINNLIDKLIEYTNTKYFIGKNSERYDIFIRVRAIKSNNFALYSKMQRIRMKDDVEYVPKFEKLIKSIKNKGFNNRFPIIRDNNDNLINGSHRLACAYTFNLTYIPTVLGKSFKRQLYNKKWFITNGFALNELLIVS